MTTPWPIDKQYPGPPEHGDTIRIIPPILTTLTSAGPEASRTVKVQDDCPLCGYKRPTHAPDCSAPRMLYPPLPARPVGQWKIALILSIGLLSAFGAGVGLVWLWGRYVVACQ